MLSKRVLFGCVAALAMGLSAAAAEARGGGGFGRGGHMGGGFAGGGHVGGGYGGGFHGGGGGFRGGYGGGGIRSYRAAPSVGHVYGGRHFRGRRFAYYAPFYGYGYDDDCSYSPRYRRYVCY
jgi:hypothetical protein